MAQPGSFDGSDAPTPPRGIPVIDPDTETPAAGFTSLGDVISAEDLGGAPAPTVLGGPEPEASSDAGDWPTLEYRSRNKPERQQRGNPLNNFFRRQQ